MSVVRHRARPLAVGVDLGGTWIRAEVRRAGRTVARVRAPVSRVPEVTSFLRTALRARRLGGPGVAALVVAARGVWTAAERRALRRRLGGLAARVEVIADVEAALLGALGRRPGVLVLAGTGSIVLGRNASGRWARAGGLGPLLGDEGSAFWLGREWLRVADADRARRLARGANPVARLAALAPRVIGRARAGERLAAGVVRAAQGHLAAEAAAVVRRLGLPAPVTVSWAGGVLADPWFRAGVRRALARRGVRAAWLPPAAAAVEAAADRAARLAGAVNAAARPRAARGGRR